MAHRLKASDGSFYPKEKCGSLHGHSVKVTITATLVENAALDKYGFVTDFGNFKPLKRWIDENLDHATLVGGNDEELITFLQQQGDRTYVFQNASPSSENIAKIIFSKASELLDTTRIKITEVRIAETCSSEAIIRALS